MHRKIAAQRQKIQDLLNFSTSFCTENSLKFSGIGETYSITAVLYNTLTHLKS
jgi:hypothetical protein